MAEANTTRFAPKGDQSEGGLLSAAKAVEAAWVKLARSLPQDDRIEALEWAEMQQLRAAIAKEDQRG